MSSFKYHHNKYKTPLYKNIYNFDRLFVNIGTYILYEQKYI